MLIHAKTLAKALHVGLNKAYMLVKELNEELVKEGVVKRTRAGYVLASKVSKEYGIPVKKLEELEELRYK